MNSNPVVYTNGTSFVGLLTIVFIILKLCNVIQWSWLWVLSPIWISWLVIIVFLVVILVAAIWNR